MSELVGFKQKQLKILDIVHEICERLDIKYSLASGTLIGAVRHKGYIPWDDDIDIMMRRNDYDIFMEKAQDLMPDYYFVQTYATDKEYPSFFGKVRDSRTTCIERLNLGLDMNQGIYIDIFPVDRIGNTDFSQKYSQFRKRYYQTLCMLKNYRRCRSAFRRFLYIISYPIMMFRSTYGITRNYERFLRKENSKGGKFTVGNHQTKNTPMPIEIFDEYELIDFEDRQYYTIKNYDLYLTKLFGDYMTPPPPEKRDTAHGFILVDTEKSYKEADIASLTEKY